MTMKVNARVSGEPLSFKRAVFVVLALLLFIVAYYPALKILISKWLGSEEYSHAFLTLPLIGYMVWTRRAELMQLSGRGSGLGLCLLLLSTPVYGFALLTQVNTAISLALFLTVLGTLIYLYGIEVVRVLFTPLFLFLLLIPVPDQLYTRLTFPLQLKVSQYSEILIRSLGVSILREGNVMSIPGRSFEVVEACSGLRSIITLMTLSVIVGYFMLRRPLSRFVLFLTAVPTAVVVNIFRVASMILLFHYFGLDLVEGTYHTVAGVLVFLLALVILLGIQRVLESWEQRKQ